MEEKFIFRAHDSYVLGLRFTSDSGTLLSSGMDNVVKLWAAPGLQAAPDWQPVRTFEGHANSVNDFALSPDEKVLATGSTDATVKLWSFPAGEVLHTLQDRKKTVAAVAISADGQWVASASYGGRAMVWTLDGQEVVGIKASQKNLGPIAFAPDGKTLAIGGLGNDITLWALPSGERLGTLSGHETAVGSLQFIHGGRTLISLGYEQSVKFWDTATWQEARSLKADRPGVRGLAFSPDEKTVALSLESRVQLWSVDDWALQVELPVSTKVVNGMAFSPNGRWFAAGAADGKIRVWETG